MLLVFTIIVALALITDKTVFYVLAPYPGGFSVLPSLIQYDLNKIRKNALERQKRIEDRHAALNDEIAGLLW